MIEICILRRAENADDSVAAGTQPHAQSVDIAS